MTLSQLFGSSILRDMHFANAFVADFLSVTYNIMAVLLYIWILDNQNIGSNAKVCGSHHVRCATSGGQTSVTFFDRFLPKITNNGMFLTELLKIKRLSFLDQGVCVYCSLLPK